MASLDRLAIAIDWLDAYSGGSLDRLVAMHDPCGVIEQWFDQKIVRGQHAIAAFWIDQIVDEPPLGLVDLKTDGEAVLLFYRGHGAVVQARLHIADNGLITRLRLERHLERRAGVVGLRSQRVDGAGLSDAC